MEDRQTARQVTQLLKASQALESCIAALAREPALDKFVPIVLRVAAETFGAVSCAYFENDEEEIIYLRYVYVGGRVITPLEWPLLDETTYGVLKRLAQGFTVPVEHLGVHPIRRDSSVVLDHRTATASPELHAFALSVNWELELNVPLLVGGRTVGAFDIFKSGTGRFSAADISLAESLAKQIALAMQVSQIAVREREMAIAREREQAAQQRAEELERMARALQETIDSFGRITDLDELVPVVLQIVARTLGAISCSVFEHKSDVVFLKFWFVDGRVLLPQELLAVDAQKFGLIRRLATGFTVPDNYLGTKVQQRTRAVVVDHHAGTPVPEFDAFARNLGWDLELNVPIVSGSRAIGALCVYRSKVAGAYTPQEIRFAESLSAQLAMAMLAKDLAAQAQERAIETVVARERERAARHRAAELARANATVSRSLAAVSQSTDFDDTLEKVFLEIVAAAAASAGQLFLYDARANTLATIVWTDERGHGRGFCPNSPPLLQTAFDADVTPAFRLCLECKEIFGINIKDLTSVQAALMWPGTTEWHLARGRESACAIPVLVGQRPVGVIGLAWKDQFSFSTEQRELLFALTNQAAMVMQLRELADSQSAAAISHEREQAAQERAGELAKANWILRRVNERLSTETNYRSVLGLLLAELSLIVGNISGGIFTFDANTYLLRFVLGIEDGQIVDELVGHPHGHAEKPADARVFLGWTDLTTRPAQEFIKMTPGNPAHPSNEWHSARRHRLLVRTPLIANEEPVGTLCLAFTNDGPLSPLKLELCNAVAQQATLALQLARLSDQARDADVARERETTILQERARFAGQIHDTLAQGFTGTLLHLEALRVRVARGERVTVDELQSVRKIAALGLAEARRSALAIRPLALDGRDLSTALQQLTERAAVPGVLNCRWLLSGIPRPLPPATEEALLNSAHEAVSNAIRHGEANNIQITLVFDSESVTLLVRDDGIGFDTSDSRQRGHTFGLRSMRERAAAVQGEFTVVSKPGDGTTVTIYIHTA